jgi:hypothetical protein
VFVPTKKTKEAFIETQPVKSQATLDLIDEVPSCQWINSSEHKDSSCKTALERHQLHMVPNLNQTTHKSQPNIPSTRFKTSMVDKTFSFQLKVGYIQNT